MTLDSLQRPALEPRLRRSLVFGGALLAVAAGTGLVAHQLGLGHDAPVVVQAPAPIVTITPVAPPVIAAAPSTPTPTPTPARALAPTIDPACILAPTDDAELPPACSWDDGFPAISADGSTIATRYVPDDGGRGYPGLSIHFLDVRTSKLVRSALVLDPDEVDAIPDRAKLQAKITRRVATVHRALDGYRSLAPLGTNHDDEITDADPARIHAEFSGEVVRVIDPATTTVMWRHDFAVAPPKRPHTDDDFCEGWGIRTLALHWDPSTRYVLAAQTYDTGGCMCPSHTVETIARIPDRGP